MPRTPLPPLPPLPLLTPLTPLPPLPPLPPLQPLPHYQRWFKKRNWACTGPGYYPIAFFVGNKKNQLAKTFETSNVVLTTYGGLGSDQNKVTRQMVKL